MKSRLGSWVFGATIAVSLIASQVHALSITFNISDSLGESKAVSLGLQQISSNGTDILYGASDATIQLAAGTLIINNISFNPDPVLTFGVNFTNTFGVPVGIVVATSVPPPAVPGLPIAGVVQFNSSISGSFTDGNPSGIPDGGTVTPIAATIAQFDINGVVIPGADAGPAIAYAASTNAQTSGPFSTSGFVDCALLPGGVCSSMSTAIGFIAGNVGVFDGANDNYGFSTRFQIDPVPEPASLVLFGSGLVGLIGLAAARRRGRA